MTDTRKVQTLTFFNSAHSLAIEFIEDGENPLIFVVRDSDDEIEASVLLNDEMLDDVTKFINKVKKLRCKRTK